MKDYPAIERWFVGGHSLGGVVASSYAQKHPTTVQGLVLLASHPNTDIAEFPISVLSITASEDHVLNMEKYNNAKGLLPPRTQYEVIEGGNHAQFGWYGFQDGDGEAFITPQEQLAITADLTATFLLAPQ